MIAAVLDRHGGTPAVGERDEPSAPLGSTLVRVDVAGLNPVDVAVASGRFYAPVPNPPYVPGAELVGRVERSETVLAGTRVWGLPLTGALAPLAAVPDDRLVRVPDGLGDDDAILAGVAGLAGWMSVRSRGEARPGEAVAILGASGVVGLVAVQAARAAGAGIVVAVARSASGRERALDVGADVALGLGSDLGARLRSAADGGLDLVVDGLWGAPTAAATGATTPGGRLVQVGNSADQVAELPG
ncbi:MAG: zinc-binding dehydrogenase, partial [Miltoncostaeaceae bacterium]